MPWSRANGLDIYYEAAGEGPPLVLLHANPLDHTMWLYQLARFARRWRVIAPDLRGYGRSDKPESPFAFADMAADVLGAMRDAGVGRAALIGVSIGATLALQIALDRPDLVRALVLSGGEAGPNPVFPALARDYASQPLAEQRAAHLRMIVGRAFAESALGRHLLTVFLEEAPRLSGRAIARVFEARAVVDLRDRLGEIAAPTLVVNGAADVSLAAGRDTARRIPNARHRIVPDAGHFACFESPAAFDAAVLEFLDEIGDEESRRE